MTSPPPEERAAHSPIIAYGMQAIATTPGRHSMAALVAAIESDVTRHRAPQPIAFGAKDRSIL